MENKSKPLVDFWSSDALQPLIVKTIREMDDSELYAYHMMPVVNRKRMFMTKFANESLNIIKSLGEGMLQIFVTPLLEHFKQAFNAPQPTVVKRTRRGAKKRKDKEKPPLNSEGTPKSEAQGKTKAKRKAVRSDARSVRKKVTSAEKMDCSPSGIVSAPSSAASSVKATRTGNNDRTAQLKDFPQCNLKTAEHTLRQTMYSRGLSMKKNGNEKAQRLRTLGNLHGDRCQICKTFVTYWKYDDLTPEENLAGVGVLHLYLEHPNNPLSFDDFSRSVYGPDKVLGGSGLPLISSLVKYRKGDF